MYVYQVIAWCLWRPRKVSDPLEIELQMVVSCHVSAQNQIWLLYWISQLSQPLSIALVLCVKLKLRKFTLHFWNCSWSSWIACDTSVPSC